MTLQETIAAAESPKTCPETLSKLYHDLFHIPEWRRSGIRKKIAGNPNIPTNLICSISHWHGRELFKNPALPLLLMEAPTLFQSADHNNLYRLISWEETPPYLLSILGQHPNPLLAHEARYHVALHPGYDDDSWIDEIKDALMTSTCETQEDTWVQYWHLCEAFPQWLTQRLSWCPLPRPFKTARVLPYITEPAPTENEADQLAQLTDDEILVLAQHPGQHPERLRLLIELNRWRIGSIVGDHHNVPQDLILSGRVRVNICYYAKDTLDEYLRQSRHHWMLKSFTEELIGHQDADNTLCQQALYRVINYRNSGWHPKSYVPSFTFLALLRAEDARQIRFWEVNLWWYERLAAALHPDTHPEVRSYIAKDSHRWVRAAAKAAQSNPDTWKRFWE